MKSYIITHNQFYVKDKRAIATLLKSEVRATVFNANVFLVFISGDAKSIEWLHRKFELIGRKYPIKVIEVCMDKVSAY